MSQLERLARPFPAHLVHSNPSGGGSYVKHSVVTEKLLAVVGPFSFELVEVVRGYVAGTAPNPDGKSARAKSGVAALDNAVVAAVCRLSVSVDKVPVRVEEVGDCEQPHNWPHDGARLKDAMSDALKRCAMRLGVTLHLWSGAEFSLYDQLRAPKNAEAEKSDSAKDSRASEPSDRPSAQGPASAIPGSVTTPVVTEPSSVGVSPSSPAQNGDTPTEPLANWTVGKNELAQLKSKNVELNAAGAKMSMERAKRNLPILSDTLTSGDVEAWKAMQAEVEASLGASA